MIAHKITGRAELSGHYDRDLDIQGEVKASSSISVDGKIFMDGKFTGYGISAYAISTRGEVKADGDINADEQIKIDGNFSGHKLTAQSIETQGKLHVSEIRSNILKSKGELAINLITVKEVLVLDGETKLENAQAEKISVKGRIDGHRLKAKEVEILLDGGKSAGKSTLRSIQSDTITVSIKTLDSNLTVDSIEGNSIHLCNTKAELVIGKYVRIGSGCEINRVEYSEHLDVSPDSTVRNQSRVNPM